MEMRTLLIVFIFCYGAVDIVYGDECAEKDYSRCNVLANDVSSKAAGKDVPTLEGHDLANLCDSVLTLEGCVEETKKTCEIPTLVLQSEGFTLADSVKGYCVGAGGSDGSCTVTKVAECNMLIQKANEENSNSTARCSNMMKALTCYEDIGPSCTGETKQLVQNTMMKTKDAIQQVQACKDVNSDEGCTEEQYMTCTAQPQYRDEEAACRGMEKRKQCLEGIVPHCIGHTQTVVEKDVNDLKESLEKCPNVNSDGCTEDQYQRCMAQPQYRDEEAACRGMEKRKKCLEGIAPYCTGSKKTGVETDLNDLKKPLEKCPNQGGNGVSVDPSFAVILSTLLFATFSLF